MTIITLLLRTQQPILATSRQGDPNSDVSYPYIPGSLLRGVLVNRYLKSKQLRDLNINDAEVRRLFFDGTTRYLNGYLFKDKQRCLPVPRCLVKNKGNEPKEKTRIDVYDLAQIEQEDWEEKKTEFTPKPLSDGFCTIRDNVITLYNVNRRINIHHLRNRKVGRATEEYGEVFRYDAIDAGQTFQAIILCDDDNDAQLIHDLLRSSESLWLGGSRSAGYGYATIDINQIKTNNTWNGEVNISPHDRCKRTKLIITLLSDTIMRNKSGQYIPDPQLVVEAIAPNSKLSKAYTTTTTCGGFNRKWGLPLPLVPALAAGSVFVLDDATLSANEIQALELRGIGEKRIDGFGRIAINWLAEDYEFQAELSERNVDDSLTLTDSYSQQLAKMMAERLLRQKLDVKLQNKIPMINLQSPKYISNSQLSRLAIVAREALNDVTAGKINNIGYISPILTLLDSDNLTNQARHQFDDTKILGKSLKQQILEWLDEDNLGSWIANLDDVKVAGITQPPTRKLKLEYTILLIMAVVKKLSEVKGNDSLS